jgi:hypothetical protein
MRQSFRQRREHLHRGLPVPRQATMLLMLAIVGLLFVQLRNPRIWRMFASQDDGSQVSAQTAGARSSGFGRNPEPPPKGGTTNQTPPDGATSTEGTDLDPQEIEDIKPSLSVVNDGGTRTLPEEQPAYFQILSWVDHQTTEALGKRKAGAFVYDTLIHSPDTMRLQILDVRLTVLQIVPVMDLPKNGKPQPMLTREGKPIYEVRGVNGESGSNLYFGMVTDLPPGSPIRAYPTINLEARLVGYFFKVQGYISQQQQLDFEASRTKKVTPLKAPLIVGRLIWLEEPAATAAADTPLWLLAVVGGLAMIVIVGWVYWSSRRRPSGGPPRISIASAIDPDAPEVDTWLEQAQSGRFSRDSLPEAVHSEGAARDLGYGGRLSGNSFDISGESINGDYYGNGHTSTDRSHFRGSDSSGPERETRGNDSPDNPG